MLEGADLSPDGDALNARGFVWDMIVRHEQQHNETMLQALHHAEAGAYSPARAPAAARPARPRRADMVRVDGGAFQMGDAARRLRL